MFILTLHRSQFYSRVIKFSFSFLVEIHAGSCLFCTAPSVYWKNTCLSTCHSENLAQPLHEMKRYHWSPKTRGLRPCYIRISLHGNKCNIVHDRQQNLSHSSNCSSSCFQYACRDQLLCVKWLALQRNTRKEYPQTYNITNERRVNISIGFTFQTQHRDWPCCPVSYRGRTR